MSLAGLQRLAIAKALDKAHGDLPAAARELGIGRSTLYRKLKKFRYEEDHDKKPA
jgi:transcriptional regulator of acetoin/glycerol metabolism